jgi:hypothetical protein
VGQVKTPTDIYAHLGTRPPPPQPLHQPTDEKLKIAIGAIFFTIIGRCLLLSIWLLFLRETS